MPYSPATRGERVPANLEEHLGLDRVGIIDNGAELGNPLIW